jgi:hypothetical protein
MVGFTYKSYNFIDKDPIIEEVRAVYQNSGANLKWIEANSGVTVNTIYGWFYGKTKKPQAATINAVLRSMGYKIGIVEFGKPVQIVPVMEQPKQKPSDHRHVVQMKKYRRK